MSFFLELDVVIVLVVSLAGLLLMGVKIGHAVIISLLVTIFYTIGDTYYKLRKRE